jgi:TonB family protein
MSLTHSFNYPMKRVLPFICAVIYAMFVNGCETVQGPQGPVNNQVTFSGKYIMMEQADVKPRPRFQGPPRYPVSLRDARITGKALIAFMVELNGHTSQVQVESATNPEFGEAAKEAIEQWIFIPGMRDGVPERVALEVPMIFNLD